MSKHYWKAKVDGNNWTDWYNCTCPFCNITFLKYDPSVHCPHCLNKIDGYIEDEEVVIQFGSVGSLPITKRLIYVYEFDNEGKAYLVQTNDSHRIISWIMEKAKELDDGQNL